MTATTTSHSGVQAEGAPVGRQDIAHRQSLRANTAHLHLPVFNNAHREIGNCLADWLPQQHIDEADLALGTPGISAFGVDAGTAGLDTSAQYTAATASAKMTATENASTVIDMAQQIHGGRGVKVGSRVERLYRDIRALRIYEGATEVRQLILGKSVLAGVS